MENEKKQEKKKIRISNSFCKAFYILKLSLVFLFITSIQFNSLAQERPKSFGYNDGKSLFSIPVYEPGKFKVDISEKYNEPTRKPENLDTILDKVIYDDKDNFNAEKKITQKGPESLKQGYSGGFLEKIINEVTAEEEEKNRITNKQVAKEPVITATPKTPKSITKNVIIRKKVSPKQAVKTSQTIAKNKFIVPFKPIYGNKIKPIKKKAKKPVIVIDPGHGGRDPGAIGKLGTKEKHITFLYSAELKKELERSGKYKVYLTRYKDNYVTLKSRVEKARRAGGDILISVHADSIKDPNVRGFSVYTISANRANREANKLARQANKREVIRGVKMKGESKDVQEAIIDFAQKETKSVSDSFSKIVARHLGKKAKPLRRTNREGSLAVLTGVDIPSVLIELGYLSNKFEEKLLRQKNHRRKIVKSIKAAIDEYFDKYDFFLQ